MITTEQGTAARMEAGGYTEQRAREWFPDREVITGHLRYVLQWLAGTEEELDAGLDLDEKILQDDRAFSLTFHGLITLFVEQGGSLFEGIKTIALAELFDNAFGEVAEGSSPIVYAVKKGLLSNRDGAELEALEKTKSMMRIIVELRALIEEKLAILLLRLQALQAKKEQAEQADRVMSGIHLSERYQSQGSSLHAGLATETSRTTTEERALTSVITVLNNQLVRLSEASSSGLMTLAA